MKQITLNLIQEEKELVKDLIKKEEKLDFQVDHIDNNKHDVYRCYFQKDNYYEAHNILAKHYEKIS